MATASESQPLLGDELDRLVGLGQAHAAHDVLFHAAELAQFGLDGDALVVGPIDDPLGGLDVLVERLVRGVDHHRAVEAAVDAVVADLFRAVVEVDGEDRLGKDLFRRADHGLQEPLVAIATGPRGRSG